MRPLRVGQQTQAAVENWKVHAARGQWRKLERAFFFLHGALLICIFRRSQDVGFFFISNSELILRRKEIEDVTYWTGVGVLEVDHHRTLYLYFASCISQPPPPRLEKRSDERHNFFWCFSSSSTGRMTAWKYQHVSYVIINFTLLRFVFSGWRMGCHEMAYEQN